MVTSRKITETVKRIEIIFNGPIRYLTATLAGALAVAAFAPFGFFLLMPVSLAVLLKCLASASTRQAAWTGWWYGIGLFAPGLHWIFVSLNDFGQLPIAVSLIILGGLFSIMAGYLALLAAVTVALCRVHGPLRLVVVFPFLVILVEWLRSRLFSGFGWLAAGYSQVDSPLNGYAPLGGVLLVGYMTAVSAGLLVMIFRRRQEKIIAATMLMAIWFGGYGLQRVDWTEPAGPALSVSLLQPNVAQNEKWLPERLLPIMQRYRVMTQRELGRDLIIWPEVAVPALYHDYRAEFFAPVARQAAQKGSVIMAGAIWREADGDLYNGFAKLGSDAFYRKHKLVPFGEYFPVPNRVREWLRLMNLPYTDFSAGPARQAPLTIGTIALGVSICYEVLFGEHVRRGLPASEILVNVSNDAWFGRSIGPAQHLEIARMRASESGRYLLRGTGTGITAVIGPRGRIIGRLPAFRRDVLRADVTPMRGATPYVRWGDWPLLLLGVLVLAISMRRIG